MDKCEALRQAKLYSLEYDELFAHPITGSGFIYVGDRGPLFLEKRRSRFVGCFFALAGLLVLCFTITVLISRES